VRGGRVVVCIGGPALALGPGASGPFAPRRDAATLLIMGGCIPRGFPLHATKGEDLDEVCWVIQCKAYSARHKIGSHIIRELVGALAEYPQGTRGMVVTTSDFTHQAGALANKARNKHDERSRVHQDPCAPHPNFLSLRAEERNAPCSPKLAALCRSKRHGGPKLNLHPISSRTHGALDFFGCIRVVLSPWGRLARLGGEPSSTAGVRGARPSPTGRRPEGTNPSGRPRPLARASIDGLRRLFRSALASATGREVGVAHRHGDVEWPSQSFT
jgi:hypothetical protein